MVKLKEVYKCSICGNIVEVVHASAGTLVCCGQPMNLLKEKKKDVGSEKHVPVIEGNKVKVGSIEHPMEKEHYIEWIEANDGKQSSKVFLSPGQKPEAEFCFKIKSARIYCNLHELWASK